MLLAKSDSGDPNYLLKDHTSRVLNGVQRLRLIYPFLPEVMDTAAIFHDFGKAASGFQAVVRKKAKRWGFRHEVLSAAIFRRCYDIRNKEAFAAYLAVLSHHKNFQDGIGRLTDSMFRCQGGEGSQWASMWAQLLDEELRNLYARELASWVPNPDEESPADEIPLYLDNLKPVWEDLLFMQSRGALVAADHLASSGVGETILGQDINLAAINQYVDKIKNWNGWSKMQDHASKQRGNALLLAPTGSGKTEAALLWTMANRQQYERIFYVLPYQVSINAMAERLCNVFPYDGETRLGKNDLVTVVHANTDLAYLQVALSDSNADLEKARATVSQSSEAARKIYAPLKVTTVYQLLALFFGRKFFEVGLLELTNSLIVFDEIHAYDGHTLGLILVLLRFLRRLNAKVFIMTATLPPILKQRLMEAADISNEAEIVLPSEDKLWLEERRTVETRDCCIQDLQKEIAQAVSSGKKVVVVCNTVDKAIQLYDMLDAHEPFLVHSRFMLRDRAKRETKENIVKHSLVIATQVIEVSLDVSFDIMFTELAPADALLQRFGRVNRHDNPGPGTTVPCVIACGDDPGSRKVYDGKLLDRTRANIGLVQPMHFQNSLLWLNAVYPDGLTQREQEKMDIAEAGFSNLVQSLRPFVDPPSNIDLEMTLFETVQVVPVDYVQEWINHRNEKQYTEAKGLTININKGVWQSHVEEYDGAAFYTIDLSKRRGTKMIIACFPYDGETYGLRLDFSPLPQTHLINSCIITDDDFED